MSDFDFGVSFEKTILPECFTNSYKRLTTQDS